MLALKVSEKSMLSSSFLLVRGISTLTERRLWEQGIVDFAQLKRVYSQQPLLFEEFNHNNGLEEAIEASESGDIDFFIKNLPAEEYYRVAYSFPREVMFLDIETTGLSRQYHYVTLIGWLINGEYKFWTQGMSPDSFLTDFHSASIIVTFNGKMFDCKFLDTFFTTTMFSKKPQIDLRFLSKRYLGKGGQKDIEARTGFSRPDALHAVDGKEAIVLWYEALRGDTASMNRLVEYNFHDILGMTYILDHIFENHIQKEKPALKSAAKFYADSLRSSSPVPMPDAQVESVRKFVDTHLHILTIQDLAAAHSLKIIGIDLAGKEDRNTGVCTLSGTAAATKILHRDAEILDYVFSKKPDLVSIDAPLSLPEGRTVVSDDDPERKAGITRYCERVLKRRGVNVYPALIQSMQALTQRGIYLAEKLRRNGIPVIECFPGAAQDIIQIPRKKTDVSCLKTGLSRFGVHGDYETKPVLHDELDAITAAIVGQFFVSGLYEAIGNAAENYLIVPASEKNAVPYQEMLHTIYHGGNL